jgi:hypothetical protein
MRTTVDLDADVLDRLRREASKRRVPFKHLLNATLRAGLARPAATAPKPYVLPTHNFGAVREGIDLDKALRLADALEDEEIIAKLARRK